MTSSAFSAFAGHLTQSGDCLVVQHFYVTNEKKTGDVKGRVILSIWTHTSRGRSRRAKARAAVLPASFSFSALTPSPLRNEDPGG